MPLAAAPAVSLTIGAAAGIAWLPDGAPAVGVLITATSAAVLLWLAGYVRALLSMATVACLAAGAALGAQARDDAIDTPIRDRLDAAYGGFRWADLGPEGRHDPVPVRLRLTEDAAVYDDYVSLRGDVVAIRLDGDWLATSGGVQISVSGEPQPELAAGWRAGRLVEAPVTFRRPARFLNDGVPDHERALALGGTTLLGSVKSGLLVEVLEPAGKIGEGAASARAWLREGADRWIARHAPLSQAIVVAILIGDRTGLPPGIRERLQAAGTYHVIAISGGNIAILAGLVVGLLALAGVRGRPAAAGVMLVLAGYAQVVTVEPSVWRATFMGLLYFAARAIDHRTSPWQAIAVAASMMVALQPLDVRSPGFILSFGATVALLEGARRGHAILPAHRVLAWVVASVVASTATELALLPVAAATFSRVTFAGLLLNLAAVPLMTVIQVAGMAAAILHPVSWVAAPAGWVAHAAATLLVESARLVEVLPWLTRRVAAPHVGVIAAYYAGGALALVTRGRLRLAGGIAMAAALLAIAGLVPAGPPAVAPPTDRLRLTMIDVGQAEAVLVEPPRGRPFLVDAAGAPFGGGRFDIGGRVLAPALWARGVHGLDGLLVTHGHPDHLGGTAAVIRDFRPRALWQGIDVPGDGPSQDLIALAAGAGTRAVWTLAGDTWRAGGATVRVLHPPPADWERREVRNDDSLVVEVVFRDVAVLLTGDIGAAVEREILPRLTPAPRRILKVAHHGSRSSSSAALLAGWRPEIALISAGRGNTFGHPALEVIERFEAHGIPVFRTDRDGQITVDTDGREISVRTFVPRRPP